MPEVTKTVNDSAGVPFNARFWDDGSGNLIAIYREDPGSDLTIATHSGLLAASGVATIADVTSACVLHSIEYAGDYEGTQLELALYDSSGVANALSVPTFSSGLVTALEVEHFEGIEDNVSSLFRVLKASSADNKFGLSWNRGSLRLPFGFRLKATNPDAGGGHNVNIVAAYAPL